MKTCKSNQRRPGCLINAFKIKQMVTIHSRQSIRKRLQLLNLKKYFEEKEYLHRAINSIVPLEMSQRLISRVLYIFEEVWHL